MPYKLETYRWRPANSDVERATHYVKYYETKPTEYIAIATVEIDPRATIQIALQVEKAPFTSCQSPKRSKPPFDADGEFVVRRVCYTEEEAIKEAMTYVSDIVNDK